MQIVQGSLVIVGVNTVNPQVLFNGSQVQGVTGIFIDWDSSEQRVKLTVSGVDYDTYNKLALEGVIVKKEQHHV